MMRSRTLSTRLFVVLFTLTFLGIARAAAADTISLMWDANPEPEVAGYIVHVGTQPATYTQHVNVGPATGYSFTSAVAGQQYCFAVSAYFAGPIEGSNSAEVCGFSNRPPSLVNPGARSSMLSQATTLQLQGTDPDGQAVSYSATGLPTGLALQSSTAWTVTPAANTEPSLASVANQSTRVGQWEALQLVASDADGDPLVYSASGLPPGLSINTVTGLISGTPTTVGTYRVTVTVSDGRLSRSRFFTWTIKKRVGF